MFYNSCQFTSVEISLCGLYFKHDIRDQILVLYQFSMRQVVLHMLLNRTSRLYMIYNSYVEKVFYMKSLRVVYEVTQGCIWSHSGLYMKSLRVVYEVSQGCIWSHSGLYMKSLRVVYEVTQGCRWSHSGLYMKSLRVIYEFTHGCIWSHSGLYMKSLRL